MKQVAPALGNGRDQGVPLGGVQKTEFSQQQRIANQAVKSLKFGEQGMMSHERGFEHEGFVSSVRLLWKNHGSSGEVAVQGNAAGIGLQGCELLLTGRHQAIDIANHESRALASFGTRFRGFSLGRQHEDLVKLREAGRIRTWQRSHAELYGQVAVEPRGLGQQFLDLITPFLGGQRVGGEHLSAPGLAANHHGSGGSASGKWFLYHMALCADKGEDWEGL